MHVNSHHCKCQRLTNERTSCNKNNNQVGDHGRRVVNERVCLCMHACGSILSIWELIMLSWRRRRISTEIFLASN